MKIVGRRSTAAPTRHAQRVGLRGKTECKMPNFTGAQHHRHAILRETAAGEKARQPIEAVHAGEGGRGSSASSRMLRWSQQEFRKPPGSPRQIREPAQRGG
jgi:hypothetical protein